MNLNIQMKIEGKQKNLHELQKLKITFSAQKGSNCENATKQTRSKAMKKRASEREIR